MKILVVIPACNEAASLEAFLPKLQLVIGGLADQCSILVVDDGSNDGTAEVARSHKCQMVRNDHNQGVGSSLRRGYRVALDGGYDICITMDADGQHDPSVLPRVLEGLKNADAVIAARYHPDSERIDVPRDRDLLNVAVRAMLGEFAGWQLSDPLSGFWGMRRRVFEFCLTHGRQPRYGIHLENLVKLWHLCQPKPRLVEVPHPAIYGNGVLLTRAYSPDNRETRVERFGTHALHIIEALEDVEETGVTMS